MAVSMTLFDHTPKLIFNKEIDFANIKAMLLDNTATLTPSNTTIGDVDGAGAKEVSGNGWTTGGITLSNVTITQVTTNDTIIDADDVDVVATGGSIGPAYACVLYDATSSKPLVYIDFGQAQSAGDTTSFKIVWNENGIIRGSY